MVSIFTGSGAGYQRGSGNIVGAAGLLGSGVQGRGGDNVSVNAATGNLLISRQDEFLIGRGPDLGISRTYNSLAQMSDGDNGDQWQQSTMRRVFGLTGTLNTAGSTVSRQSGDGSVIVYTWDAAKSAYITTDGDGAHEKLVKSGATWVWTNGSSQWTETYEVSKGDTSVYRIKEQKDTDGYKISFAYLTDTDKLDRVTTANHGTANADTGIAEQSYVQYIWLDNNISQIITGYTDYGADIVGKADDVNRTLTRTHYAYDGQNRLITVTVDLSPEDNSITDGKTYVTTYGYDGSSNRVASITQTDGSSLIIAYDASGRVATLTQAVAGSDVRVTRIGYGVNVSSVTGPDGQVTRLWYDGKGQLVQLMSPPATQGGPSQVQQFEYDASGNLLRTIETTSSNASTPNNLVQAASWGDSESGLRGDNLVDDSGWPQDVDGTLPASGTIGQGWTGAYTEETEWTVTSGPYGKQVVSLHAGQTDTDDPGGGAYSTSFAVDKSKAYEFTLYFKVDELGKHAVYFGLGSGIVKNGTSGAYNGNPYFAAPLPDSSMEAGKWYKIVGYVLPGSSALEAAGSYGGIYDTETGERIKTIQHFIWDETQTTTTTVARFFNFYNAQNQGEFTHFFKPEVREVADAAILRGDEALDIARDRNLVEAPYPNGWSNTFGFGGDGEARWDEVLGPDGAWQVGLQTGQFDTAGDGGGAYTNTITIDPTKAYRFTQYVRKSDLTRHAIYFGLTNNAAAYVKNATTGGADTNPYFLQWGSSVQQANMDEDGWYKIVGYVLPEGSANIAAGTLGGVYDAATGDRVGSTAIFRWNETRPNDQVYARFFTYYDETMPGWSTDWLAPEVVEIDGAGLAADNADPFGVTYDEDGRITRFTYDANGNVLTVTDPNNEVVTRTYGAKNEILTETRNGSDASGASVSHTTRYVYDVENHLRYVISAEGRVTEYRYTAYGVPNYVIDYPEHTYATGSTAPSEATMNAWRDGLTDRSSTRMIANTYDGRDNLYYNISYGIATTAGVASTVEGYSRTYHTYDQSGQLLSRYNQGENAETFLYDGLGRLVGSTDLAGGTTTIVFADAALQTTVTTGSGATVVSVYNKAGDLISETQSGSYDVTGTANYLYDENGRVRVATDATGYKSYYLYDKVGRKVADINHYGHVTEYRYDASGRVAATARYTIALTAEQIASLGDPNNDLEMADIRPGAHSYDIWSWSIYDAGGRLIESIDGDGGVAVFSYDASDRLIKTVSYSNKLTSVQLASFRTSPPTASVLPAPNSAKDAVSRSFYDADGRLIGALDGEGYLSEIVYDEAGQKVDEIAYAAKTASSLWASGTFAQLRTNAGPGAAANRHMRYVYDGQGLLRYTVDNAGYVSSFAYNYAGKPTTTIVHAAPIDAADIAAGDFTYDAVKSLVTALAVDANDRESYSVYNAKGQIAYAIGPGGTVAGFAYDIAGHVSSTTEYAAVRATSSLPALSTMDTWASGQASNAGNRVTRSWYTAGGSLRFALDAEGYVTRFDYDAEGRITREVRWPDNVTANDATTIAEINTLANGAGSWTDVRYTYDAAGRRNSVYDGEGNRTVYSWYANGTLSSVYEAYGTADQSRMLYVNDGAGRTKAEYHAYGETEQAVVQYAYDGLGNRTSVTDARGKVTSYTYDERGLVLTATDAAGGVSAYEYNAFGEVVKTTDAKGGITYRYYDGEGRLTLSRDAEDYVTETSYTAFGEVASVTRYYNRTTSSASTTTPPTVSAHTKDATTNFVYDKRGLVTKTTDAEGWFESYGYDAYGNRTSVTAKSKDGAQVAGGTTTYAYDKRGLLLSETLPVAAYNADGSVQAASITNSYAYDARGNRIQMIEAAGLAEERVTSYVYDKANRLTRTQGEARTVLDQTAHTVFTPGFVPEEILTYDGRGQVTSRTDAAGVKTVYFYDDLGRVSVTIDGAGSYTAHSYDANGNVTETRVYETAVTVPDDGGAAADAPSPPTTGTSRATTFAYDNLNRLLTSSVAGIKTGAWNGTSWASGTTAIVTTFVYDAMGNVVKTIDANGKATWSWYDKAGRKTAQVDAANYLTSWTYDAEGNVLVETRYSVAVATPTSTETPPAAPATDNAKRITTFTYDKVGNRLSEARSGVAVHDGAGGVLAPQTVTISWQYNGLGQVLRKTEATGELTDYVYDAGGRLIQEKRAAFTSHQGTSVTPTVDYNYNGLGDLARTVAAGAGDAAARETRYTYGAGGLLSTVTDATGVEHEYFYDERGTVIRDQYYRAGSAGGAGTLNAVLTKVDALGRTIEQSVASWNASTSTWAKGDIATTEYSRFGEVARSGINGLWQTQNEYDGAGRLVKTNAGDGVWKLFGYDKAGNQTLAITSAGEDLSGLTFDAAFAKIGESDVNATYTQYDARGLATGVTEEQRQLSAGTTATIASTRAYNAFGEVLTETDANGGATTYSYNAIGRMIRSEGPAVKIVLENGKEIWVKPSQDYYYDKAGRLVATRDANGSYAETGTSAATATSKAADSGNLTRLTLLAGTGYGGGEAMVTAETHADGGVKTTKYDIHGDARLLIDELGYETEQNFDAMGRVTERKALRQKYVTGTTTLYTADDFTDSYRYDSLGQLTQHWNSFLTSGNKETTDYDVQGRVTSARAFGGDVTTTGYVWNAGTTNAGFAGSVVLGGWTRTTTFANGKTLIQVSDVFGHETSRTDLGGHVFTFGYDRAGRMTSRSGNGESGSFAWLNTGLVGTVTSVEGGVTTSQVSTYDALGNKLTESQTRAGAQIQNATATYDAMNRLATWSEAGNSTTYAADTTYAYDANSNIRYVDADYRFLNADGSFATWDAGYAQWYRYDNMNRMVLAKGYLAGTAGSGTITGGTLITYDEAGRRHTVTTSSDSLVWTGWRASEPGTGQTVYADDPMDYEWDGYHWTNNGRVIYSGKVIETYSYDDAGLLDQVYVSSEGAYANGTSFITPSGVMRASVLRSDFTYDAMGRVTSQRDYESGTTVAYSRTDIVYNAKGQVTSETQAVRQKNGTAYLGTITSYITNTYGTGSTYALGAVVTSAADVWKDGVDSGAPDTLTTNVYGWYDGAVITSSSYKPDTGSSTTWSNIYTLGASGAVKAVDINDGRPRDVIFKNDVTGQAIRRDEADTNTSAGDPHSVWYRFNGREMGRITNDGTVYTDYTSSIGDRQAQSGTGAFQFGAVTGRNSAEFGIAYEAINSFSQGSAGGGYVVQAGDTLAGIAQRLYGDANLWYKIAEANGLSSAAVLVEGRTLTLPPGVSRNANTAATFKPYDPAEALGDVSPTNPKPQKAPKCGLFGQFLVTAIAIGLSAWLGPQFISAAQGALGLGGAAAGSAAATGAAVGGGILGGAAAGAVSSAVSQAFGAATGIQNGFSWKGVGLAAIGGAIGGGISGLGDAATKAAEASLKLNELGKFSLAVNGNGVGMAIGRSVFTNAATQGIGIATKLQSKFDFAAVAVAGIVGGMGAAVSNALPGHAAYNDNGTLKTPASVGNTIGSSAAGAIAGAATRSALTGENFGDNLIRAIPDLIANSLILAGRAVLAARGGNDGENRNVTGSQVQMRGGARVAYIDQPENGGVMTLVGSGSRASDSEYDGPPIIVTGWIETSLSFAGRLLEALGLPNPFGSYYQTDITNRISMRFTNPAPLRTAAGNGMRQVLTSYDRGPLGVYEFRDTAKVGIYDRTVASVDKQFSGLKRIRNADFSWSGVGEVVSGGFEFLQGRIAREFVGVTGISDALSAKTHGRGYIAPADRQQTDMAANLASLAVTVLKIPGGARLGAAETAEFQILYRGDASLRSHFVSDVANARGLSASDEIIANAERRGTISQLFEDHSISSSRSPYISLSSSEEVAQHFARGVNGDQAGFVTIFKVPKNYAEPNFENMIPWEREYLAPTQIDPRYIVNQYQVNPKR